MDREVGRFDSCVKYLTIIIITIIIIIIIIVIIIIVIIIIITVLLGEIDIGMGHFSCYAHLLFQHCIMDLYWLNGSVAVGTRNLSSCTLMGMWRPQFSPIFTMSCSLWVEFVPS